MAERFLCLRTDWGRRRALMGKWTLKKKNKHQCQIAVFEAFYLAITACLTYKKTVHWLVCLNSCGKTWQTTLLVFIQDRLSGKCDVNWSRAIWWQREFRAREIRDDAMEEYFVSLSVVLTLTETGHFKAWKIELDCDTSLDNVITSNKKVKPSYIQVW